LIDALFAATWGGGPGIETPDLVGDALRGRGFDAGQWMARGSSPEAKECLRRNTEEAIARGAFGVPTLFVQGEMFFGFDAFPEIEAFVRGEDPVAQKRELIERWAALPASATRPKAQTSSG
jgi:2-hydroxychromene-2-carboxylate isomerase